MAVPVHLNIPFGYLESAPITDVADIVTTFRAQVTGLSTPWTDQGGGLFKSPVDAAGRWFDVLLTKIAATSIECRVRDNAGATVCTVRMQVDGSPGNIVRYFYGTHYFHIEVIRSGAGGQEWLKGGMLDLSPEAQNIHNHWCYGDGSRRTSDAKQDFDGGAYFFALDDATYTRNMRFPISGTGTGGLSYPCPLHSPGGGAMFMAASVYAVPTGAPYGGGAGALAGRLYQHVLCPTDAPHGAKFKIPVDANERHWFKVLASGAIGYLIKMACRIPDPA